ncbi:hypothetical protein PDQ79_10560 [Bacillus cereus]|nr:hypothetical protein [Bacillus cereus]
MIKKIIGIFCVVTIISQWNNIVKDNYKQEALKSKEKIEVRYVNDPGGL